MLGQVIDGKYEILRLVGEGGMGAVYEARHKATGRLGALKVISNDDVTRNATLIARFEREAQAAAKVMSPHIVEILDAGHDAVLGQPYMVMALLVGTNVQRLLKQLGPLPPELAIRIAVQTCFGLEKAHSAGVVHRDIKPANLFLCDSDGDERVVKLLDFGVAKFKMEQASEDGADGLTRTGSVLGSPMFMSPEQARGLKTIDHRADIWSLGIVLYQLLCGKTPHSGIEGIGELIITICSEEPAPLRKRAPWISPRLEKVVHGALTLAAADRYQSAAAMREALLTCLADPTQWHINKSALTPLSDDERAARPTEEAAPNGDDGATVALDDAMRPASPPAASALAAGPPARPPLALPAAAPAAKRAEPALAKTPAPTPRRTAAASSSKLAGITKAVVAVAVGIALGVVTVAFLVGRSGTPPRPGHHAAHAVTASTASAATSSERAPDPVVSSGLAAPTAASTVAGSTAAAVNRVTILPLLAGVVVDGKRAERAADGTVLIEGPPNSSHTVIVTWRGAPTIKQVVLTDRGPVPNEISVSLMGGGPATPTAPSPAAADAPKAAP